MEEMPCSRVVLLVQLMIISLIINSAASESYSSMIRSHRKAAYAAFFVALLWYNLEDIQQPLPLIFTIFFPAAMQKEIHMTRPVRNYKWKDGKMLSLGDVSLVMGILNVTPDSFSDGGLWNTKEHAMSHMKDMAADGAAMIDVGAESTRPGHTELTAEEETARLMQLLPLLLDASSVPISIDSYHYETMEKALSAGAHMVNDVWGFQYDDGSMAAVTAAYGVPAILMHNQNDTVYEGDIISSMKSFFDRTLSIAFAAGVKEENIILDPGIGFGKTGEQNMEVLARLDELTQAYPYPWLLGVSRKRFIGTILDLPAEERDDGTAAVNLWGIEKGCTLFRVHDVKTTAREVKMWDALRKQARLQHGGK